MQHGEFSKSPHPMSEKPPPSPCQLPARRRYFQSHRVCHTTAQSWRSFVPFDGLLLHGIATSSTLPRDCSSWGHIKVSYRKDRMDRARKTLGSTQKYRGILRLMGRKFRTPKKNKPPQIEMFTHHNDIFAPCDRKVCTLYQNIYPPPFRVLCFGRNGSCHGQRVSPSWVRFPESGVTEKQRPEGIC